MSNKEQVFHGQVSLHNNRFLSLTKDFCFIFFFFAWWECHHQNYWVKEYETKGSICWWWTVTICTFFWAENSDEIISFLLSIKFSELWNKFKVSSCILFCLLPPFLSFFPSSPLPPLGWEVTFRNISVAGRVWSSFTILVFWQENLDNKIDQKCVILFACS